MSDFTDSIPGGVMILIFDPVLMLRVLQQVHTTGVVIIIFIVVQTLRLEEIPIFIGPTRSSIRFFVEIRRII